MAAVNEMLEGFSSYYDFVPRFLESSQNIEQLSALINTENLLLAKLPYCGGLQTMA